MLVEREASLRIKGVPETAQKVKAKGATGGTTYLKNRKDKIRKEHEKIVRRFGSASPTEARDLDDAVRKAVARKLGDYLESVSKELRLAQSRGSSTEVAMIHHVKRRLGHLIWKLDPKAKGAFKQPI